MIYQVELKRRYRNYDICKHLIWRWHESIEDAKEHALASIHLVHWKPNLIEIRGYEPYNDEPASIVHIRLDEEVSNDLPPDHKASV